MTEWHIFPGFTLSQLHLSDCNDTVDGICQTGLDLKSCIQYCEKNGCRTGYYVKTANGNSYCAPLREYSTTQTSPYYRLAEKSIYPELRDMQSFVFSNYPYPPNLPNVMFYSDHFTMSNGTVFLGQSEEQAVMTHSSPIHAQFLPKVSLGSIQSYVYVRNGDSIVINIPKTAYVLRGNQWVLRANVNNPEKNTLKIICPEKKLGETLNYDDRVIFETLDNKFLGVNQKDILIADSPTTFQLSPKVEVYYCDGSECKGISLDQTDRKGDLATYKGQPIQRNPTCWNTCKKQGKSVIPILILVVLLLIVIGFMKAL